MDRFSFYKHHIDLIATSSEKFSKINVAIQKVLTEISQDEIADFFDVYHSNNYSNSFFSKVASEVSYVNLPLFQTKFGYPYQIQIPVKIINDEKIQACFRLSEGNEQIFSIPIQNLNLILLGFHQTLMNSKVDYGEFLCKDREVNFNIDIMKVNVKWFRDVRDPNFLIISSINFEF